MTVTWQAYMQLTTSILGGKQAELGEQNIPHAQLMTKQPQTFRIIQPHSSPYFSSNYFL